MDEKDRSEKERLSAIRQRARDIEHGGEVSAAPGEQRPEAERTRRGPVVSAWRPARARGPMSPGYPGMIRGFPGYPGEREPDASWAGGNTWSPRAHVFERGGCMVAQLELPGIDKDDVEVHVEEDRLVVEGERPDDRTPEERAQTRGEARYGPFRRELPLPHAVDPSHVKARFRNGLLEVSVPQPSREERRKEIKIEG